MTASPSSAEALTDVLTALRDKVLGVSETVISTADGLLVVADVDKAHAESIAALAAASLGLGNRMADQASTGPLREVVARGAGGHVVVLAVGERALLTVIGDEGMDVDALRLEAPLVIGRLAELLDTDAKG